MVDWLKRRLYRKEAVLEGLPLLLSINQSLSRDAGFLLPTEL